MTLAGGVRVRWACALSLLASWACAPAASAADWRSIARDGDGNVYSLDRDSVRGERVEVSGVVRNEYAEPRRDEASGKAVFAALDRLVANCETASFALQSRTLVAADGSEIPSIASTRDQLTFRPAAAGSLSATVVRALCLAASGRGRD